jgi:hypothetical protein
MFKTYDNIEEAVKKTKNYFGFTFKLDKEGTSTS